MKVLYSCLSRSWGGLEMRTIQGAEQLSERDIDVEILCYPGSSVNIEAQKKKLKCITIKASGYFHPLRINELSNILKKKKFDLIHSQYSKDLWLIVPSLNLLNSKIPLVLTKRMESSVTKKDFLHKKLYNRVNLILAISNLIKENVLKTCPVPADKVQIHYNGVELRKYDPTKADGKKIRKEFNIQDDEIVIGMTARITPGKGYEELLKAADILLKEFNNLRFLLIGTSSEDEKDYERKVYQLVSELSLNEKVIFTGFREDLNELYAAMDIFAFPSHSESFGSALIEAMAMEKPSVATNSHGIPDIIEDGVTGLLFKRKDANDLTSKLREIILSKEKRERIGKSARESVIAKFNLEEQTNKIIEIYKRLITQ